MKILVAGANGQLGKCLHDVSVAFKDAEMLFLGQEHFDLSHFGMVTQVLQTIKPDWVINAAAYTAVDKAEQEQAAAMLVNGESVGHLAKVCAEVGAKLIHISTDYVFDGTKTTPYVETDPVNPLGVYGATKLQGEQLALQYAPGTIVIRTSWVYSKHGANFVKTMLRLMKERTELNVVSDQFGCPTYAIDLAEAVLKICTSNSTAAGIFHFSNSGPISWFDFATAIRNESKSNCQVNPIPTSAYPTPAKRPAYSVLSFQKFEQTFGIAQKPWLESLQQCIVVLLS